MKKKITILGSTGSIGTQALEVVECLQDKIEIVSLSAGDNVKLLIEQIEKFNPQKVCTKNKEGALLIKDKFPKIAIVWGEDGLIELCLDKQNDMILVAVTGKIGLKPTVTAIENGIDIALANKETLVIAGEIIMKKAKDNGVNILPVDSEHSAIHQCIKDIKDVNKLIITASGGPFKDKTFSEMQNASVEQTLAHPRWNMGKKISVDSATLMNKGLEIIEAHHLFGMDYDKIEVVIHPQSIVHSAIELLDGSILAQIGLPSMHIPIQYALTYPQRVEGIKSKSFNFMENSRLDFEAPDFDKFPCLKLTYEVGKMGSTYPICLNAANETAVEAFLNKQINFGDIYKIVEKQISLHTPIALTCLDEVFEVDAIVREKTKKMISF